MERSRQDRNQRARRHPLIGYSAGQCHSAGRRDRTGKTTLGVEFVYRGASMFGRTRHHRPVRSLARQARARCGGPWMGSSRARARGQTENHLHDTAGVPPGAAAARQSAPRGGCGDRRPPHLRGRRGRRSQRGRQCGASRLFSRARRRAAAREPHGRLRGRSDGDGRRPYPDAGRRIDRRHRHPIENGRAVPRHGAVDRDRQVARARLSDGPALVPDRGWPGLAGVPAGAGASPGEPRPRRRLRSDDARVRPALPASTRW